MNGKTTKVQGRGGTAPLPGESSLTFTTFTRARNNRVASSEFVVLAARQTASRLSL